MISRIRGSGSVGFDVVRCAERFLDRAKDEVRSEASLASLKLLYEGWRTALIGSYASGVRDAELLADSSSVRCGESSYRI